MDYRYGSKTASKLLEEFLSIKKRYWGLHFWARGFFCATSGEVSKEMIKTTSSIILNPIETTILELNHNGSFDPYPCFQHFNQNPPTLVGGCLVL